MPPADPQGEPSVVVAPEPSAAPQAPGSATAEPAKVEVQPKTGEDYEALRKSFEKKEMEANNYKNKLEKIEQEKEEARKAELSEVDRLKEELAQARASESQREMKEFRDSVVEDHLKDSPAALKAAKALIAKNPLSLVWSSGATDQEAAKAELIDQLDALKEAIGGDTTVPPAASTPRANNPSYRGEPDPDRAAMVLEARKTGDFSKLIHSVPSVQAQIKTFESE